MEKKIEAFSSYFDLGITRKLFYLFLRESEQEKNVATQQNARSGANPPPFNYLNLGSDKGRISSSQSSFDFLQAKQTGG